MKDKRKEFNDLIKLFKKFMNMNRLQQLKFINMLEKRKEAMTK